MNKRKISHFIYAIIVFSLFISTFINNKTRPVIQVNSNTTINSIIIGVNRARGYKFYFRNDSIYSYKFDCYSNDSISSLDRLGFFLEYNDSVYKKMYSDTIFVYRKGIKTVWVFEE